MLPSLLRGLIAFGAVWVSFQVYYLVVTPQIEPVVNLRATAAATEDQWASAGASVGRYQRLLAGYFPPGHWSLAGSPKVIESGDLMLVLDDYKTNDRGGVELTRCAVVAFQTPRVHGEPLPRDAIIFEAPGGALLRFDQAFDPARGKIGRLVEGYFPGELTARSDMREPGPDDDLWLTTRDLRFRESIFFTDAEVRFRFGAHAGSGRRLETRLLMERHANPGQEGPAFAGVSSLELREEVQASIDLGGAGGPAGPMRLTSEGPFRFDFTRFVASFQRRVQATIPRPSGPSDQLLCAELHLRFSTETGGAAPILNPEEEPDLARRQGRIIGGLKPHMIEAIGNPVRVDSAAERLAMRGRRLRFWVTDDRFRIDGDPATIAYGHNETQAAWIDYQAPPRDTDQALGDLSVSGPGWLRVALRQDQPDRVIEARWGAAPDDRQAVRLQRDSEGHPVMTVATRNEVAATGLGSITADELVTHFREIAPDGPEGPAIEFHSPDAAGSRQKLAVLVERTEAIGSVSFRGHQLTGATERLLTTYHPREAAQQNPGSGALNSGGDTGSDKKAYRLSAGDIRLEVGLFGRRATPTSLHCRSGALFEEVARADGVEPLRVKGAELRIDDLHRQHARITVAGAAGQSSAIDRAPNTGMAEVQARGLRLWAKDLHVDQAASRVWAHGAGNARMRLDERASAVAGLTGDATLRWAGGLEFDGARVRVLDEVFGEVSAGWVHCSELVATLAQPIDLSDPESSSLGLTTGPRGAAEGLGLAQVECLGGVTLDHRTSDNQGQLSHERVRIATLSVNQISGAISGSGPGWVRSVRLTSGDDTLAKLPGQTGQQSASPSKLRFARVNFQRGLSGNLNQRAIRFHERVRAVYGPVLAWEHELPVESPSGPPPDTVTLACNELRVNEDPAGRYVASRAAPQGEGGLGPVEVQAVGAVRLEGASGDRGASFLAEGVSASYTQLKEVFVLQGDASRSATLWVRKDGSSEPARSVARKISYDRRTGRVKAEDIRGFDYQSPAGAPSR